MAIILGISVIGGPVTAGFNCTWLAFRPSWLAHCLGCLAFGPSWLPSVWLAGLQAWMDGSQA